MINNKTIAVVVPAYNEERQIRKVIEHMPEFVDRIVIVDDGSKDETVKVVSDILLELDNKGLYLKNLLEIKEDQLGYNRAEKVLLEKRQKEIKYFAESEIINKDPENERIILIRLKKNSGVGAAVARGYKWCLDHGLACVAKMDGDGQMDPAELESICRPVVEDDIDYVKGNRLIHQSAWYVIPKLRFFGNAILSILTKIASGYWHVSDTQTAFAAISHKALNSIQLHKLYHTYGYPNDILVKLNMAFCTISEVCVKPIYEVGESSKMKIMKVIFPISWLLLKSFVKRLWIKYLFRDFHPLFFLYHFSLVLLMLAIPYSIEIINNLITEGVRTSNDVLLAFMFLFISGFQSLLFAMWMDMQDNNRLYKT
jgi:glycosyltransferase involved in cell wall biosynthesis